MKRNRISLAALVFTLITAFFACKPAEVAVDPNLNATAMPVKGRNGFRIGQVLRYGEFSTDKVRRGWTKGYDVPFFVRFQGAKEKMSFTQFGPEGTAVEVACISKFKSTEIELVRDYFYIPIEYTNFFAGTIVTARNKTPWDFILHNPTGDFLREEASAGFIQKGDQKIEIAAIRGLKGQPEWMKELTVYGHEFRLNGKVVGAVSMVNKGTVWIDASLDAETRTVLAAVATGLLLRTNVEEGVG